MNEITPSDIGVNYLEQTAVRLLDFNHEEENLYTYLAQEIKNISGAAFVVLNTFEKNHTSHTRAIIGMPKPLLDFAVRVGFNPENYRIKLDEHTYDFLLEGKLVPIPDMYSLSLGTVPKSICKVGETMFSFGDIYQIGFTRKGQVYGSYSMIFKKGQSLQNRELIEAFTRQATIALQNKIMEDQLRRSEILYRHMFDHGSVGVYRSNEAGDIEMANAAFYNLFGCDTLEEFTSRSASDYYSNPELRDEYVRRMERDGYVRQYENTGLTKNGEIIYFLETAQKIKPADGSPAYYEGMVVDLTEVKQMHQQLHDIAKTQSHSFRRPLATLMGLVNLALDTQNPSEQQNYLNLIKVTSEELDQVIHQIVDLTNTVEKNNSSGG